MRKGRETSMLTTSPRPIMRQQVALRLAAIGIVLSILIIVSWMSIMHLQQVGPAGKIAAQHPEHIDGTIISVSSDRSFTLRTSSGIQFLFSCSASCHASLWHMQRHIQERAHTDVWYINRNDQLQALYID